MDNNSAFKYSDVAKIRVGNKLANAITILNNPIGDKINIRVAVAEATNTSVKIINANGQVIYQQKIILTKGDNFLTICNGVDLSKGMYTLQAIIKNEIVSAKFLSVK